MRNRNIRIHIYLNNNEFANLMAKVKKSGMSREQYLRLIISGLIPREAPPADYYKLICDVRKVGSNINQLLKVANSSGLLDVPKIRSTLESIRKTEQMLWDTFAPEKL